MKKQHKIIFLIIIIAIIIVGVITVQIKTNYKVEGLWDKYSNKPILGSSETGSLFDPCVIKDGDGKFRMYVSWRNKGAIAVTTSEDGINWDPLKIVLERDETSGWENIINRATVIYKDGKYLMWYTGQEKNISRIGYAVSDDGYNFTKLGKPILVPEKSYEKQSVMNPDVMYDSEQNLFKMWYAAGETYEPDVIGYATSIDGIEWEKYDQNPVLKANENKKALDNYKVGACEVHKINNEYLMFYIGYTDINTARIFVAKSKDGVSNWIRCSGNPIVQSTKGTFDNDACYKPTALWNEKTNKWMLWYMVE